MLDGGQGQLIWGRDCGHIIYYGRAKNYQSYSSQLPVLGTIGHLPRARFFSKNFEVKILLSGFFVTFFTFLSGCLDVVPLQMVLP